MPPEYVHPDRSRGISEVFGVMLILAITIIVAAVVAAFAGGFSFDSGESPLSATIIVSKFVVDSSNDCSYIVFDHMSGDPVNLDSIEIALGSRSSSKERAVISNRLEPGSGKDETGTPLNKYIAGYGVDENEDGAIRIATGDRFRLYADGRILDDGVFWKSSDTTSAFSVKFNDHLTYQIIDTRSQRVISSGMIAVPEPS